MKKLQSIFEQILRITLEGQGNNWVNMATLGLAMRNEGIDFRLKGYEKLGDYVESTGMYEFYLDRTCDVPVKYVREKKDEKPRSSKRQAKSPSRFCDWAFIGRLPEAIKQLADIALQECWTSDGEHPYDILLNYINYTFIKLMNEKKILYSEDAQYAAFNTGLVDRRYLPIYGLFKKNSIPTLTQEWYLVKFTVSGEGSAGKTLNRLFSKMPERASYISEISDICFDSKAMMAISYDHIILDRVDRLPLEFLEENGPASFDILRLAAASESEKDDLYNQLRESISNDIRCYRRLQNRLDDAISLAISKTEWNYKTAIPSYNPREDSLSILLPLSLVNDDVVDVALVLTKSRQSGNYQAETILSLPVAYKNARLITRPDSYWMNVSALKVF
jgi:hypothetical protein